MNDKPSTQSPADTRITQNAARASRLPGWMQAPQFDDPEKARIGKALNTILLLLMLATCAAYFSLLVSAAPIRIFTITGLLIVEMLAFGMLRLGWVRPAAMALCSVAWALLVMAIAFTGGVGATANSVLTVVVLAAGLLMGSVAGVVFAVLSTLAGLVMLLLEMNGMLPTALLAADSVTFWIFVSLTFLSSAGLITITSQSLNEALQRARHNEQAQLEANRQLESMRTSLEAVIEQRTHTLEQRSRYLQASADVSHAAASILDIELLMQQTVDLIRQQFELYYVGLFLLDPEGDWAVLRSGTGEAGRAMVARGHRIRLGTGMIGWSIANAQPRVALHAGEDAVRLAIPDLPETRSEAAIPLRSRGRILGALSVQSQRPDAFGEIEISAFQALADQVALAIDNARLFQESQRALDEMQRAYGEIGQRGWQELLRSGQWSQTPRSYRYDRRQSQPDRPAPGGQPAHAASAGTPSPTGTPITTEMPESAYQALRAKPARPTQDQDALFVPINIRNQPVGVLKLKKGSPEGSSEGGSLSWSQTEIELLQTISEQLGIALDSARLYQDAQRLAQRERLTAETTSRMRQTLDIETILRTTIEEIQRNLSSPQGGLPQVIISLGMGPQGPRPTDAHQPTDLPEAAQPILRRGQSPSDGDL
ncbi:MAG: GAF domain-containing protein [Chloroflexota bacterium]